VTRIVSVWVIPRFAWRLAPATAHLPHENPDVGQDTDDPAQAFEFPSEEVGWHPSQQKNNHRDFPQRHQNNENQKCQCLVRRNGVSDAIGVICDARAIRVPSPVGFVAIISQRLFRRIHFNQSQIFIEPITALLVLHGECQLI